IALLEHGSPSLQVKSAPALPAVLAPSNGIAVDVEYAPSQVGGDGATLAIASDDPNAPSVHVPITGNGVQPGVLVFPNQLMFSQVRVGGTLDLDFAVTNSGTADLGVSSVRLQPSTSADFSLVAPRQTPFTLAPAASQTFTVRYAPATAGTDAGAVLLDTGAG